MIEGYYAWRGRQTDEGKKGIFEVSLKGGTKRYQNGNIEEAEEGEKASEKKNRSSSIDEAEETPMITECGRWKKS